MSVCGWLDAAVVLWLLQLYASAKETFIQFYGGGNERDKLPPQGDINFPPQKDTSCGITTVSNYPWSVKG